GDVAAADGPSELSARRADHLRPGAVRGRVPGRGRGAEHLQRRVAPSRSRSRRPSTRARRTVASRPTGSLGTAVARAPTAVSPVTARPTTSADAPTTPSRPGPAEPPA